MRTQHPLYGITLHASMGTIVDAADLHAKAMVAVNAGYLAQMNPAGGDADYCRFDLTDKGRALLAEEKGYEPYCGEVQA